MLMPKFWVRSEIIRCTKLDNSSSKAVRALLECLVYSVVLAIGFHSKLIKWLLPPYYDDAQVLGSIGNQLVYEIGHFKFKGSLLRIGVVGVFRSSSDWISLKTQQMTPPTILWWCQSFGLDRKSIGVWNWTLQVQRQFVPNWSGWCIP